MAMLCSCKPEEQKQAYENRFKKTRKQKKVNGLQSKSLRAGSTIEAHRQGEAYQFYSFLSAPGWVRCFYVPGGGARQGGQAAPGGEEVREDGEWGAAPEENEASG